jgi:molybdopterin-guanine dinucleotide biosynthesis protein A
MGTSKAVMEWHGSSMARRVVGIVSRGVEGPVVVVRSPGQPLPSFPRGVEVLDDRETGRGPLAGMAVGLAALAGRGEVAYVSCTDAPMLHPAFVRRVVASLDDELDACVPCVRGFRQPLAAAYSVDLAGRVQQLLDAEQLRVADLLGICRWVELDEPRLLADADLARLDPGLDSVTNLNDLSDYELARARPAPAVAVDRFGDLRPTGAPRRTLVRAATVGAAAAAVGTPLGDRVTGALNGELLGPDPEEPTVEGDVISLTCAAPER